MDHQSQEMIDDRVSSARAGLAERLQALERRVECAVDSATNSATETVEAVRNTVTGVMTDARQLYHSAADGVRDVLDIPGHVRAHPWPCVALSAAAGFLAGFLPGTSHASKASYNGSGRTLMNGSPARSGPFAELWDLVRKEMMTVGETAIVAASNAVKQNIQTFAQELPLAFSTVKNGRHSGGDRT
jgi:ElaB/YqjD/DUF883 family membrane-anchored ribosome-binding protein